MASQLQQFTSLINELDDDDQDYHDVIESLETALDNIKKPLYDLKIIDSHVLVLMGEIADGSQKIITADKLNSENKAFISYVSKKVIEQFQIYYELISDKLDF